MEKKTLKPTIYLCVKKNRNNFADNRKKEKTTLGHKVHFLLYEYSEKIDISISKTVF